MSTNSKNRSWLIISWRHIDHQDAAYGQCIAGYEGDKAGAEQYARQLLLEEPDVSPIGIVEEVI